MEKKNLVWGLFLVAYAVAGGCRSTGKPELAGPPTALLSPGQLAAFSLEGGVSTGGGSLEKAPELRLTDALADTDLAYCQAKFGEHEVALEGCRRYADESYQKLVPVFQRASLDSEAVESKRLAGCVLRHDGPPGVDWMLVENCFARGWR
ncbi:MAG: hypothetical protein OSB70_04490 [Myxococcota bacterium]|nr:hypothetical protein [Myxococcota bacterium]